MKKQKTEDTMNPPSQPQDPPHVRELYDLDTTQKVSFVSISIRIHHGQYLFKKKTVPIFFGTF